MGNDLTDDGLEGFPGQAWAREKIEEGLKSGNAGALTRERLREIVGEGIALAEKDRALR